MRRLGPIVVVLAIPLGFACSNKLDEEKCDHLLGRGVGLAAYAGSAEVPVDIAALKARARGDAKKAVEAFGKACVGAKDDDVSACARRANNEADFEACGPLTKQAHQTGELLKMVIARAHDANECARYAENGVKIGIATVDGVGDLVKACDQPMEEGVYACRLAAKDKAAWDACDAP